MPRPGKKTGRRLTLKGRSNKNLGDVTINDFANSPTGVHARLKKATTSVSSEVKQVMTKQEDDDRAWDEKFDDFNEVTELSEEANDDKPEDGIKKQSRHRKKGKSITQPLIDEGGIDYPLDLWFLISEYISPEAVGKFASICKSSCHVVKTAKFWFHLYKRYYKSVPGLPERLQPECMVRLYGLRACVIRTLHYTYFAFRDNRIPNYYAAHREPYALVKRQCCLMWHKKGKARWYFFFKMKDVSNTQSISLKQLDRTGNRKPDLVEILEDVSANPEEGCKVLRVACAKYSMVPMVIGLTLQTVTVTLSSGYDHHKLQLGFGTACTPKNIASQLVVLDGVIEIRVLDWWSPFYPHQDMATTIVVPPSNDSSDWNTLCLDGQSMFTAVSNSLRVEIANT
ncbi:transmembrane protein 183A isoform X2 [Cephus cinctus]|uniref:Transmembrane protein 183A isoform X2 n=1 Tax=Cephus cinctus TaxID=211228 RepID=A0AAJ7FH37_CEPCN|nr:transmembrane protein 183A isoform X2 [Cephus cinctus]